MNAYDARSRRGYARTPLPPRPNAATGTVVPLGADLVRPFMRRGQLGQDAGPGNGGIPGVIATIPGNTPPSMIAALVTNFIASFAGLYVIQTYGLTKPKERIKQALVIATLVTGVNNVLIPMATGD